MSLKTTSEKPERRSTGRRRSSDTPESLSGVPEAVKKGVFYQHDSRDPDPTTGEEETKEEATTKKDQQQQGRKSPEKWSHDKFDDREESPRKPRGQGNRNVDKQQGQHSINKPGAKPRSDLEGRDDANQAKSTDFHVSKDNRQRRSGGGQNKQKTGSTSESANPDAKGLSLTEYLQKSAENTDQAKVSFIY